MFSHWGIYNRAMNRLGQPAKPQPGAMTPGIMPGQRPEISMLQTMQQQQAQRPAPTPAQTPGIMPPHPGAPAQLPAMQQFVQQQAGLTQQNAQAQFDQRAQQTPGIMPPPPPPPGPGTPPEQAPLPPIKPPVPGDRTPDFPGPGQTPTEQVPVAGMFDEQAKAMRMRQRGF